MGRHKHIRFDWAIKRLLRQKANFVVLEGFLTELLKFDVKIQEIIESEGNQESVEDKFNRVDLLAKNEAGELILIEIQNEKQHDYFHRMNYAQAKLITEHITVGTAYAKVKKVYSINIVYFELGQGDDYVYVGRTRFRGMHKDDNLELSYRQKELYPIKSVSDIFAEYYIIKINNFDGIAQNTLDEWIYFLKNSEIKDDFKAKGLAEAKEKLRIDNLDGREKDEYDNFIKIQRIRESEITTAVFDGISKLKEELLPQIEEAQRKEKEARQKEKAARRKEKEALKKEKEFRLKLKESVKQMKAHGMPISTILNATGLSLEELEDL